MSREKRNLQDTVERQTERRQQAERERDTILAQTAFLGTLGVLMVLPIVAGAYLGRWLDQLSADFSARWTLSFLLLGVAVGAYSAYLFVRSRQ